MIKRKKLLHDAKPKSKVLKRTPEPITLSSTKDKIVKAVFYKPMTLSGKVFRLEVVEIKMQGFKPISRPNIIFFSESRIGYGQLKHILKEYQTGKIKEKYVDAKTWDKGLKNKKP